MKGGRNLNKKAFLESSVLKGSNERAWSFLVCECHMGFEDDGRWAKDQRSTVAEGARVPWRRGTWLPEYLLIYNVPNVIND